MDSCLPSQQQQHNGGTATSTKSTARGVSGGGGRQHQTNLTNITDVFNRSSSLKHHKAMLGDVAGFHGKVDLMEDDSMFEGLSRGRGAAVSENKVSSTTDYLGPR